MASSSEDPYEAEEHAVDEHDLQEQPKKKWRINEPRDHSDKKIKVFIRAELNELNWSAGSQ